MINVIQSKISKIPLKKYGNQLLSIAKKTAEHSTQLSNSLFLVNAFIALCFSRIAPLTGIHSLTEVKSTLLIIGLCFAHISLYPAHKKLAIFLNIFFAAILVDSFVRFYEPSLAWNIPMQDYLFFGDVPDYYEVTGSLVISISGLFIIYRDYQTGIKSFTSKIRGSSDIINRGH